MSDTTFTLVTTEEALHAACRRLSSEEVVGLDTETTAIDPRNGRLRLLQLAGPTAGVFVIDLDRLGGARPDSDLFRHLRRLLSSARPLKIAHHSKFDLKWIQHRLGTSVTHVFDTMLAAQLLDFEGNHSLKSLAEHYLAVPLDKSLQSSDWSGTLSPAQLEYAARDAEVLLPLREALDRLIGREGLERTAALEFDTVGEIARLELDGIAVDGERFEDLIRAVEARRDSLAAQLYAFLRPGMPQMTLFPDDLPSDLNLDSPTQLSEAFGRVGVTLPPSTRSRYLIPLAEQYEAVELLLDYRAMQKLATSFGRNILRGISRRTGRLHATYRQIGTITGRITCEKPNLQQLPTGGELRGVFRAPEGRVMIIADYSTFELRVLAEASGDRAMIKAFQEGRDLHRETAAMIFKCAPENVTASMRQAGKHLNLGVVYGLGVRGLARKTGQTEAEARRTLDRFFSYHPELKRWIDRMAQQALEAKCVRTLSGRVVRFTFDPDDGVAVAYVRRLARNAPAQGTAADILKRALVLLGKRLRARNSQVVNIIHDEVVVEAPRDEAEEVAAIVSSAMIEAGNEFLPHVPVEAQPVIGFEWRKD